MPQSRWPTPLGPDDNPPSVKDLLESGDLYLTRQAAYMLVVAERLQKLDHEIDTFQQPMKTVTIPLVTMFEKRLPQLVFTWSEGWDEEAIDAVGAWVRAVHAAGIDPEVPIAVVSNTPCAELAEDESLMFVHMHASGLPGEPREDAPEAAEPGTPEEALQLADKFVRMIRRQTGALLAFTPDTLDAVDSAVDQVRASGVSEADASGMIYAVGCYVGEVIVRNAGGAWCPTAELGMEQVCSWPIVVRLPSGAGANPIGKAFKRFRDGEGDSLVFFYESLGAVP